MKEKQLHEMKFDELFEIIWFDNPPLFLRQYKFLVKKWAMAIVKNCCPKKTKDIRNPYAKPTRCNVCNFLIDKFELKESD